MYILDTVIPQVSATNFMYSCYMRKVSVTLMKAIVTEHNHLLTQNYSES